MPGASSLLCAGFLLRAGSSSRIERNAAAASAKRPREARRRPRSKRAPQRAGGVAARLGAAVPLGEKALGELQVALGLRRLDEEREEPVGKVLRVAAADLAGEDDRGRVVAAGLAQEALRSASASARSPDARAPRRAGRRAVAARAAPRAGAPRRALERGRVEARLEGVQRDAQRPPRDGAALPLQEREEELQRAEAVARLEAQRARGEPRGDVEEVVRRDVTLEERDRGLAAARRPRGRAQRDSRTGRPRSAAGPRLREPGSRGPRPSGRRAPRPRGPARSRPRRPRAAGRRGARRGRRRAPTKARDRPSTGRPGERPPAHEVEMQVEDALAGVRPVVRDDTVAGKAERAGEAASAARHAPSAAVCSSPSPRGPRRGPSESRGRGSAPWARRRGTRGRARSRRRSSRGSRAGRSGRRGTRVAERLAHTRIIRRYARRAPRGFSGARPCPRSRGRGGRCASRASRPSATRPARTSAAEARRSEAVTGAPSRGVGPAHGRRPPVEADVRAEAHELARVQEAVLEDRLRDPARARRLRHHAPGTAPAGRSGSRGAARS